MILSQRLTVNQQYWAHTMVHSTILYTPVPKPNVTNYRKTITICFERSTSIQIIEMTRSKLNRREQKYRSLRDCFQLDGPRKIRSTKVDPSEIRMWMVFRTKKVDVHF